MIRLFAALSLPPDIADVLAAGQNGLSGARWRSRESLHITLRFFGDIPEDRAADLDEQLTDLAIEPFVVSLRGVGYFDEGADINAIWAGIDHNPSLKRLARSCDTAARRSGLKPDKRRYHPHVTLAYLRRPDPVAVAGWIQAKSLLRTGAFIVDRFGLYSSWRGAERSQYRLERTYALSSQ